MNHASPWWARGEGEFAMQPTMTMVQSLITGASGFIGKHLAAFLTAQGQEVACLVRPTSDVSRLDPCRIVYGDVTDRASIAQALSVHRPQVVYHLAGLTKALRRQHLREVNEVGTRNLLTALADLQLPTTVVLVSTLAVAGPVDNGRAKVESDPPRPVSDYGRSKLDAESVAREFADRLSVSVVRPPIVIGPYDRDGFEIFKAIARLGVHAVPSLRGMKVSWIHVEDLMGGLVRVADAGKRLQPTPDSTKGIYYVTSPEPVDYGELGQRIGTVLGRPRTAVVKTPVPAVWSMAAFNEVTSRITGRAHIMNLDKAREATAGSWVCSGEKLRQEVGYECQLALDQALMSCANWYRQAGWLR